MVILFLPFLRNLRYWHRQLFIRRKIRGNLWIYKNRWKSLNFKTTYGSSTRIPLRGSVVYRRSVSGKSNVEIPVGTRVTRRPLLQLNYKFLYAVDQALRLRWLDIGQVKQLWRKKKNFYIDLAKSKSEASVHNSCNNQICFAFSLQGSLPGMELFTSSLFSTG